ncbi:iron-sulfur cluster binding protein, putative [Synechococcus sp. PCC 7335]|nr:tRNA epoxyqueuosine(34) reductase QueG [Synechococcus sp. PCC 7335]EDX85584.1 iron-sulfur cluster binding protein, putative [Synechococcus sp. PCC 7335]
MIDSETKLDSETIKQQAIALGFHKAGIAAIPAEMSESEQTVKRSLQSWLSRGYQADMTWMSNPKRQNVRAVMPEANAVICVALNYYTDHQRPIGSQYAKISRYGWGRDYHRVLTKKLKQLAAWLCSQSSGENKIVARPYADTGPVQDKFWAQQAGIGWNAKNGNVISREYGSWIFLGEIITNLELTPDLAHTAHCGSCTRCITACPTKAIREPGVVDANRCIAYHTIENRTEKLPEAIASNLQNWVAGCDICQDVCPWNQRFAKATDITEFQPYPGNVAPSLAELATITEEEWQQRFPASALRRIKPPMLRRNASAAMEYTS